jgi:hypothetical protein
MLEQWTELLQPVGKWKGKKKSNGKMEVEKWYTKLDIYTRWKKWEEIGKMEVIYIRYVKSRIIIILLESVQSC